MVWQLPEWGLAGEVKDSLLLSVSDSLGWLEFSLK